LTGALLRELALGEPELNLGPPPAVHTRRRQSFALALASLWTLALLGGQLHRLEQPHAVCAEHGELVHAGSGSIGGSATAAAGQVRPGSADAAQAEVRGLPSAAGARADVHHDHCQVVSPLTPQPVPSTPAVASPDPARSAVPAAAVAAARPAGRLFALAPKTSPPSA
jgi:hypothetical protein